MLKLLKLFINVKECLNSLINEKERDEDIVEMTVTKMMIFELKELLVNTKMFLTLMNETMMKMK